ncbi:hypothetical protein EHS25_003840 [Saitozyma podzolica]|uniref:Uncharacterized protein n=1 Tax=Saitozyma podzolica TaxID=1890683 RepID=A0A427Y3P1_9TREE|nr:hypothetical protein EHS25_003840 [Saitozyma podzolica]
MSQSPLARSTRRSLPAFAHPPSRLSKSHTTDSLSPSSASSTPSKSTLTPSKSSRASFKTDNTPASSLRYRDASTSTLPRTPDVSSQVGTPTGNGLGNGDGRDRRDRTPHTPIHYSPFATSTPDAGLSKSASIPFDMAGSAKAARRAEQDKERRKSVGAVETPNKRKRLVRQKSTLKRLSELPQSVVDYTLLHFPTSIHAILPPAHLANPISLVLHTIHFLLVAPLFSERDEPSSILRSGREGVGAGGRWGRWEDEQKARGRGLAGGWTMVVFTLLLVALAAANSIYLFTRFRTYDMQMRSAQEPVSSPNASPVPAPKRSDTPDDPFVEPSPERQESNSNTAILRTTGKLALTVVKWTCRAVMSGLGRPSSSPADFCLNFFCAYPPSAPLLTHLLTPLHPLLTPLIHLTSALLLSHLATSFSQLVKDRLVLSAEVMREYDRRFVYKRVFASRVDRSVQTSQAEMVF